MRSVARDRYVNGINGEFLCIKGRFAHPFINHDERIKTPLIRYKKGGKLIPATWDEAIRHTAAKLQEIKQAHGGDAIGVVGSPRTTNEANYALLKFAREVVGTNNYTATDAFSLAPFFAGLSAPLATHRDIRHAKTILLIGGEPEELQPLTGRQIRQAVRNGGAKLVIVNSVPIRLKQAATQFIHMNPGAEDAAVLAFAGSEYATAAHKMNVETQELIDARRIIEETTGDVVVMFGELSATAQTALANIPSAYGEREGRRFLFHPLPLYNNSVGVHDLGLMNGALDAAQMLDAAGTSLRALYVAGSFLPRHLAGRADALSRLDFLVVQEMFETETTQHADVVFPAASYAETDGTFTNNSGLVQRVRQSIPPVHQSRPDWMITDALALALGVNFDFQWSAGKVFLELARNTAAYAGMKYALLKDETQPVQARHALAEGGETVTVALEELRATVEALSIEGEKLTETPPVGHELFKPGTLTGKTPQFPLLDAGNPKPPTVLVSPLYQITVERRVASVIGD
jgi:predicted molibdopterin-dependent oxidoreductase YjgC